MKEEIDWSLIIAIAAAVISVGSVYFTRRQAIANERLVDLETTAIIRVIVRKRFESNAHGLSEPESTRWEVKNDGRAAALDLTVSIPEIGRTPASMDMEELAGLTTQIYDLPAPLLISYQTVVDTLARKGKDNVRAHVSWHTAANPKRIEKKVLIELGAEVHPKREPGDVPHP
jgi:hypothetical protein